MKSAWSDAIAGLCCCENVHRRNKMVSIEKNLNRSRNASLLPLEQLCWIPDFSQPLAVMRALLVAVGISFLLSLLRSGIEGVNVGVFGPIAFLSVWICCLSVVGLQFIRRYLGAQTVWVQASLAVAWMLCSAALCVKASGYFSALYFGVGIGALQNGFARDVSILEAVLITLVIGAILLRGFYAHFEMQQQQQRLLQANYDALQARIRPHFLFNSLNSVAELIAVDPERAENAVLDLSDLFRAALSDKGLSSISDELAVCEKYLAVEKLRMGDRLHWQIDVDAEVKHWQLPALWLQPLVENAVLHGIQQIIEGGLIRISVNRMNKKLVVRVENPLPQEPNRESVSRGTGTALANVQARLEAFSRSDVTFSAGARERSYVAELKVLIDK